MNPKEIENIVEDFRKTVCSNISDAEVESVLNLCVRKIELTGQNKDYMSLLLPDELKNYVIRRAITATTLLRQLRKEDSECAVCV